jgi:hypothetical protein
MLLIILIRYLSALRRAKLMPGQCGLHSIIILKSMMAEDVHGAILAGVPSSGVRTCD